ncbi:NAD(P)/FAD-dependent oxidoreductase [Sulfitobacter aestuarii]|uniref:NAD(P)/FAD-dependent oxidoreductase n=1 Tax=Sulfitobacter aestuarii TaxID=2161676 RepID=A0ABW5U6H0_9RHOB
MIQNELPSIAKSVWSATSHEPPECPPFTGNQETDVAIIGGGFTGLTAALHLAKSGVCVTLLEAETPGWGASGRNGGQLNPGLKEDPDKVEQHFGPAYGKRAVETSGKAVDLVASLIAEHEIDCSFSRPGWIQPIHDMSAWSTVARRVAQWQRREAPLRMLSETETADLLGTGAYKGAMLDERGGQLHPLNYAIGLAKAAIKHGAKLHAHSRVLGIEKQGASQVLRLNTGQLRARRVLICTNGYTDQVAPQHRRTVVPIRSIQIATDPLTDNLRRSILPHGHSASDSRRLLLYFRLDADGRFLMGGRGDYSESGLKRQFAALHKVTRQIYPQLEDTPFTYHWGGYVAMTADHYPHLASAGDGVMSAMGYNGRGVAMATALGKVLADWASGVREEDLDFPVSKLQPIPFHFMRRPAVAATIAWSRLRDTWG